MVNPDLMAKTPEEALVHIIEECAEVIKDCTKAQRFGLHDINPKNDKSNLVNIMTEMKDVNTVYDLFLRLMIGEPKEVAIRDTLIEGLKQLLVENGQHDRCNPPNPYVDFLEDLLPASSIEKIVDRVIELIRDKAR